MHPNTNAMNVEGRDEYGESYRVWKGWNKAFEVSKKERLYFAGEFGKVQVRGTRLLELGFGAGSFMRWAKDEGAEVAGCELIDSLCLEGQRRGFDTRHGSLEAFAECRSHFDLIVAFDVLEHIAAAKLPSFLIQAAELLKPGGVLIARTPNGASPWGLFNQLGDHTHVTSLCTSSYLQLLAGTGLRLVECRNEFRARDPKHPMKDLTRFLLRDLVNRFFGFVYSHSTIPMDPNIVAVMERVRTDER